MGCGCGGTATEDGDYYLVTKADGNQVLVISRPAAAVVVSADGGSFEGVSAARALQLQGEGVAVVR